MPRLSIQDLSLALELREATTAKSQERTRLGAPSWWAFGATSELRSISLTRKSSESMGTFHLNFKSQKLSPSYVH